MIKFEFNTKLNILEVYYMGDIRLNEILEYGEMIRQNVTLPRFLRILTDATSANYQFTAFEINEIMFALNEQIKPYQSVKNAFIHTRPVETAFSILADNAEPIKGYQHKVFSTREVALDWLLKK